MKTISEVRAERKAIIDSLGSKIFQVVFIKKNGEVRTMSAQMGVTKHYKGVGRNYELKENQIYVYNQTDRSTKTLNLDTLMSIKCGAKEWSFN